MYSAGASQGVRVVKLKAMIVFVYVVTSGNCEMTGRVSSPATNDTREPRRAHSPIKSFLHDWQHTFPKTLGSLVENSQSQLSRTCLTHQLVLNAPPISCNHVGHAHEVRVQEQSCQGYALVITYPRFSSVQISYRACLSPNTTAPRRISSQRQRSAMEL